MDREKYYEDNKEEFDNIGLTKEEALEEFDARERIKKENEKYKKQVEEINNIFHNK